MRLSCEVIRDLLPLYAEDMLSPESCKLTEEHLADCMSCRMALQSMKTKTTDVKFRMNTAEEFARYEKKKNKRLVLIIAAISVTSVIAIFSFIGVLFALICWDSFSAKIEVDTDPLNYSMYMGNNAEKKYRSKWEMNESIFPHELTSDMNVQEYKMVYYNPWDAQYLSYLTVTYMPSDYEREIQRLTECGITPYEGYYGVTGFTAETDPIAMYADEYQGFVYAIHTPDKENTITYVELIFCNYFYDINYNEYISSEYLPIGFDATDNNPYRKKKLKEK